jgi:hypothetical protein
MWYRSTSELLRLDGIQFGCLISMNLKNLFSCNVAHVFQDAGGRLRFCVGDRSSKWQVEFSEDRPAQSLSKYLSTFTVCNYSSVAVMSEIHIWTVSGVDLDQVSSYLDWMRFDIFTAVSVKSIVFYVVMPWIQFNLVLVHWHFRGKYCLHLEGWKVNRTSSERTRRKAGSGASWWLFAWLILQSWRWK